MSQKDFINLINGLHREYLYPERVDWKKLLKQTKQIKNIEIFLQTIIYHLNDNHSRIENIEQNNFDGISNNESIVSIEVINNKLKITYYGYMKPCEIDNLKIHYMKLYNIFKNNNISEVEVDISEFPGGNVVLSILFIKFLFQRQDMRGICYLADRDDIIRYDLYDFHPDINNKVRNIPNLDKVKSLKVKIGINTRSSGQMLSVMFLSVKYLYKKFKFIGCDTCGDQNSATAEFGIKNYCLIFSKFHFSTDYFIFKGSIRIDEINSLISRN